jgi:tripartite-type tricarboxylate transporter receptor subunit TctC
MIPPLLRALGCAFTAIACVALSVPAAAQTPFPNRPIRIVVPFAPGGNTDVVARIAAQRMQDVLGQPVLVENRAGAGGLIATDYVAKAAPDGYTLLMASVGPQTISPGFQKVPYDPVRDFAPVSNVNTNPLVLMVHPSVPAKSIRELIDLARQRPGTLNYGSGGTGGLTHFSGEIFRHLAKVDIVHVPYKGGNPATAAAVAGDVQITFANYSDAIAQIKGGKLRALGITSAKRYPQTPDVPTIAEAGVPGYECESWNGLLAPANTPPEVVNRLSRVIQDMARDPAIRTRFTDIGSTPVGDTPEQFRTFIQGQVAFWAKLIRDANIQVKAE